MVGGVHPGRVHGVGAHRGRAPQDVLAEGPVAAVAGGWAIALGGVTLTRNARKVPVLSAGLAVVGVAILLITGSVIGFRLPSALASGLTSVADWYVPGTDPWGTAFDSSGRVWVAMPGCDLAPSCPAGTPPGKLALFDPSGSSFVSVVSLPA